MSNNVLKIVPLPPRTPNVNCITALEEALERARTGETIGVAIIEQDADTGSFWTCGGFCGSYSMLGAILDVQQVLVSETNESF